MKREREINKSEDIEKIKQYLKRNKIRYYFDIFRKTNLKKFRQEIGFTSSKKREKLNKICIIKNIKNSK